MIFIFLLLGLLILILFALMFYYLVKNTIRDAIVEANNMIRDNNNKTLVKILTTKKCKFCAK